MSAIAHGVDIVQISRIQRAWKQHGDSFIERIYTPAERAYCMDIRMPVIRFAGRFAAKEAVMKALGTGWRGGMHWTDIETLPDELGKPLVRLHGEAAGLATNLGIRDLLMSISHAGDYAIASAIGVR
ncbi:MAG: holo-ACP synthase [Phycisphaerales bacterium]|nr:holo-ACP synthase [Phycisphaerales bacterium]